MILTSCCPPALTFLCCEAMGDLKVNQNAGVSSNVESKEKQEETKEEKDKKGSRKRSRG